MIFLKKIKEIVVEYWEIFVGGIVLLFGIFLGTSGSREKVLKNDIDSQKKAAEDIKKGTDEAIDKHSQTRQENLSRKEEQERAADEQEKERKKELLKDSEKLDTVLEEKYGLKGE